MKDYKLTETKIGTAKVVVDILPKGKVIPNTTIKPTSITIHMTGNVGASARNNHNYMKNCNKNGSRIASWHFTCGYDEILQAIPTNKKGYHAGCSQGNNGSICIEIAMYNDKEKQLQAYKNAIELVKILMKYHKFSTSQVKRHYDFTKKHCPAWLIEGKWGYTWSWFKGQLTTTTVKKDTSFLVKIIYEGKEGLNIRQDTNTKSKIMGQVYYNEVYTIVEVKGDWGRLKSNVGWISLNAKYVKKI